MVSELAHHYGEAAAADPEKAVEYATRAGDQAYAALAADDAVHWYGLALEHLEGESDDVATRVGLLTRLGRAEFSSGSGGSRDRIREAARQAHDAGLDLELAEALLVHTRTSFDQEQESDPEQIELLEHAMERLADEPALRARIMGKLAIELLYTGDVERRTELLREAREIAATVDDPYTWVDVEQSYFNSRPRPNWSTEEFRRDRAAVPELLAAARTVSDPFVTAATLLLSGFYALGALDGDALRTAAAELGAMAESTRNGAARRMQLLLDQMIATIDGRLVEAQSLSIELVRAWSAAGMPEATTYQGTTGVATRREQARLDQIIEGWSLFLAMHPTASSADSTIAFALLETGDVDGAASRLDAARAGLDSMPPDAGWPIAVGMWSEVAAGVADRESAAILHQLLEPIDGGQVVTGGIALGPATRHLARLEVVLDRRKDADRHFAASVEQSRSLDSPVWTARCQLDWADTCFAQGDRNRAAQLLADAEATMGSLDLTRLEQQAVTLRERLDA